MSESAKTIEQMRAERDAARQEADQNSALVGELLDAMLQVSLCYECPNAGDPTYDVDYGIGHGHICQLCGGTGSVEHPWNQEVLKAISATKPAALERVQREAAAKALEKAAMDLTPTGPSPFGPLHGAGLSHACQWLSKRAAELREDK